MFVGMISAAARVCNRSFKADCDFNLLPLPGQSLEPSRLFFLSFFFCKDAKAGPPSTDSPPDTSHVRARAFRELQFHVESWPMSTPAGFGTPDFVDPSSSPAVAFRSQEKGGNRGLYQLGSTANCHDRSWPSKSYVGVFISRVTSLFNIGRCRSAACWRSGQDMNRVLSRWRGNGEMGKWGKSGDAIYSGVTALTDRITPDLALAQGCGPGLHFACSGSRGMARDGNIKTARP